MKYFIYIYTDKGYRGYVTSNRFRKDQIKQKAVREHKYVHIYTK